MISIRNKNNFPLTRETVPELTRLKRSKMMKKIGPAMCVEYVDANNRRFVISFDAFRIDHQIYAFWVKAKEQYDEPQLTT